MAEVVAVAAAKAGVLAHMSARRGGGGNGAFPPSACFLGCAALPLSALDPTLETGPGLHVGMDKV